MTLVRTMIMTILMLHCICSYCHSTIDRRYPVFSSLK